MRKSLLFSLSLSLLALLPSLGAAGGVTMFSPNTNPANVSTSFLISGDCNNCATFAPATVSITVGAPSNFFLIVPVSTAGGGSYGNFSAWVTLTAGTNQTLKIYHNSNPDPAFNSQSNAITLNVAGPAAVLINSPPDNQWVTGTAGVFLHVSDTPDINLAYVLDGIPGVVTQTGAGTGVYTADLIAPAADGPYDIDVSDDLGRSASVTLRVDATAPGITGVSPQDNTITTATNPTLSAAVGDPVAGGLASGVSTVAFTLDGGAPLPPSSSGGGTYSFNTSGLSSGLHAVTLTARDVAGNVSTQSWVFYVDSTAPTVTGLGPANLTVTADSAPMLTFTASDPLSGGYASGLLLPPTLRLDGALVVPSTASGSDPYTYTYAASGLSDGVHQVTATARDLAGNSFTRAWVFTVDSTPPTASNGLPLGVTNRARPRITAQLADPGGSGVAPLSVSMTVDSVAVAAVYNTFTSQVSFTPPSDLTNGLHDVTVDLLDRAGNAATQLSFSFNVDNTLPTIGSISPADLSLPGNNPTLSFQLEDPLNNGYAAGLLTPPALTFDGGLVVSGLVSDGLPNPTYSYTPPTLGNGVHSITVTAQDLAGNVATRAWIFYVDGLAPTANTPIPAPSSLTRNAQPAISLRLTDGAGGSGVAPASISMTVNGVAVAHSYNGGTGTVSYTPPSPLADGVHNVTVDFADNAGNAGAQFAWSFSQDTAGPAVAIQTMLQGFYWDFSPYAVYDYIWGYVTITAMANDSPSGVSRVAFYRDGVLRDTAYFNSSTNLWSSASVANTVQPSASFDSTLVTDGNHSFFLTAFDTINNQSVSLTRTPYVLNGAGAVSVISPTTPQPKRPEDSVDVIFSSTDPLQQSAILRLVDSSGTVWGQTVLSPLTITGGVAQPISASVQIIAGIPDGTALSVSVTVSGASGQVRTAPIVPVAYVDSSLPTAGSPSPVGLSNTGQPLITALLQDAVSGIDPLSVTLALDGVTVAPVYNTFTGQVSYTPPAALAQGAHQVSVGFKDAAGNAGNSLAWDFTVDSLGPQVSLAPVPGLQAGYGNGTLALSALATDAPAGVSRVAFYAGASLVDTAYYNAATNLWSGASVAGSAQPQALWDSSSVADGPAYGLYAVAYDRLGNSSQSLTQSVGVNNNGPVTALLQPAALVYKRPGATVDALFSFSGAPLGSATLTLVDASGNTLAQTLLSPLAGAASPLSVTVQVPAGAADGLLSLRLRVTDLLGQQSDVVGPDVVLVDSVPPVASQPAPLNLTGSTAVLISALIADAASGVEPQSVSMTVDGAWVSAVNNGISVSFTAGSLGTGPHHVTVDLRDRAGNQGPQLSWTFNVDLDTPLVLLTQPLPGAALRGSVALQATANDAPANVSRVAFYDGATLIDTSWFNGSTWKNSAGAAFTAPGAAWDTTAVADGAHSLTAVAWDQAGNSQTSPALSVTVDNTQPSLSLGVLPAAQAVGGAQQVYVSRVTLKGTVSDAASGLQGLSLEHRNATGQAVNSSTPQLAIPTAAGDYSWQLDLIQGYNAITVTAVDQAGNSRQAFLGLTYVPSSAASTVCQEGGSLSSANGSRLDLPSGALSACVDLGLQVRPAAGLPKPQDASLSLVGDGTAVSPNGLVFLKLATLTLTYTDADLDQDQDGTPDLAASGLRVAYHDGNRWVRLGVDSVDTVARQVRLRVNHTGLFALYREGMALATDVKVFLTANPFRYGPGRHTDFVFDLPQAASVTLKIFDLKGQRVRTLVDGASYGSGRLSLAWDGKSGTGDYAGSGVYLYRFEAKLADGSTVVKAKTVGVIQ